MSHNPYAKYKQTQVTSASREQILLMLYEGAIKYTKLAIKAAEDKKVIERCTHMGRAYDIVMELNNTLDHTVGGEISATLEQLYTYITEQYTEANITGEPAPLKNALKILETLYEGWQGAIQKVKTEQSKNSETR